MSLVPTFVRSLIVPLGMAVAMSACGGGGNNGNSSGSGSSSNPSSTYNGGSSQPTTSGGNLAAPTNVQIILQGRDSVSTTTPITNGVMTPPQPNHLTIGWKSVSGATSYNIYRSVNQGTYTLYASVTATAATTAYSSYKSSATSDYQTSVDSAYQDTAATNAVGASATANSAGTYFPSSTGYTYKVSAVNADGEGTLSTDSIAIYFAGGLKIMHQGMFNNATQLTYADTGATGTSPLGYTTNAKWTPTSAALYINPYSGNGASEWNFNVRGFNYMILNVQATQSGASFQLNPELQTGVDYYLLSSYPTSTSYGTLIANQWVQIKIPLSDLMVDKYHGTNAVQYAFYKVTINANAAQTFWLEWYFSVN